MADSPTFSYSRISLFDSCAKSYEYRYIQRIPEELVTIEQLVGKAIHGSLEWLYAPGDEKRTSAEVCAKYDELWRASNPGGALLVKKERSHQDYFDEGLQMVRDYHFRVYLGDEHAQD